MDADVRPDVVHSAASFLGMWLVMMVAMMLPSLIPMLRRFREAVGRAGETGLGWLTLVVAVGYFFVWAVFGVAAFPLGVALAGAEMQRPALSRAVPVVAGAIVLLAGAFQFSAWKARYLARCRVLPGRSGAVSGGTGAAFRYGLRLGLHCVQMFCGPDDDPPGHRGHGPAGDGARGGRDHPRTPRTRG